VPIAAQPRGEPTSLAVPLPVKCSEHNSIAADRPRPSRAAWVLIAVLAVVPHLNALHADFTFDDIGVVRDNPAVRVHPAVSLFRYVYQPGSLYRPLTMLTYVAITRVDGGEPATHHIVNLALHVGVSLAVFALGVLVLGSTAAAGAAALLFAAHPIHTEAVTGIVGRAELLAAFGILLALLAFARSLRSPAGRRWPWSALSLAAFAAALLAKESAATGLGLLAVLHWWLDRRAPLRRRVTALAPYGLAVGAYLALRLGVVGSLGLPEPPTVLDNPLASVDALTRLRTAVVVLGDYVGLLLLPAHLSADYSYNQIPVVLSWTDPRFLFAAALLVGLAASLLAAARSAPVLVVAALFTVVPLALTANLLFPIGTIKAERLLYLPSVGWCLACGWLAAVALRRWPIIAAVALVAVLGAYGLRTWIRNADWRDEAALFAATVAAAPESAKAHYNNAVSLERAGRLDQAMLHYRRALEIYSDCAGAAFGIGRIYSLKGIDAGALYWFERALRIDPKLAKAHLQIALLRQARGEYDAAQAALLTGLETDANNRLLLVTLSAVQLAQGDRWRAAAGLARLDGIGSLEPGEDEAVATARNEIEVALR